MNSCISKTNLIRKLTQEFLKLYKIKDAKKKDFNYIRKFIKKKRDFIYIYKKFVALEKKIFFEIYLKKTFSIKIWRNKKILSRLLYIIEAKFYSFCYILKKYLKDENFMYVYV